AASGAILGDNLGFWIGREGGYRLLRRYGRYIRLEERRLKLGQYLFMRHGGKVVFFGRFVAVLRTFAAFLAGTNRMPWPRFLFFNATGGIGWATLYGLGGYFLGDTMHRLTGTIGTTTIVLAAILSIGFLLFLRRHAERLFLMGESMQRWFRVFGTLVKRKSITRFIKIISIVWLFFTALLVLVRFYPYTYNFTAYPRLTHTTSGADGDPVNMVFVGSKD